MTATPETWDGARLGSLLRGEWAASTWERLGKEIVDALLAKPLREVLDEERTLAVLDAALSAEAWERVDRPLAEALDGLLHAAALGDDGKLGDHVPPEARRLLHRLATRPGALREETLRALLEHEAMEGVMREVLFEALAGFWAKTNPFGEGGLFAVTLGRFLPIGLGRALEALRADFEKRLEPEMRRFLERSARAALRSAAGFIVARQDDPAFVRMREELLALALEQPVKALASALPAEVRADARRALLLSLAHGSASARGRQLRELFVRAAFARYANEPVGKILEASGVRLLDPTPFLRALWPVVRAALDTEPGRAFLSELVDRMR